eukprot:4215723-Pyramimonas_sp.AAC.1
MILSSSTKPSASRSSVVTTSPSPNMNSKRSSRVSSPSGTAGSPGPPPSSASFGFGFGGFFGGVGNNFSILSGATQSAASLSDSGAPSTAPRNCTPTSTGTNSSSYVLPSSAQASRAADDTNIRPMLQKKEHERGPRGQSLVSGAGKGGGLNWPRTAS